MTSGPREDPGRRRSGPELGKRVPSIGNLGISPKLKRGPFCCPPRGRRRSLIGPGLSFSSCKSDRFRGFLCSFERYLSVLLLSCTPTPTPSWAATVAAPDRLSMVSSPSRSRLASQASPAASQDHRCRPSTRDSLRSNSRLLLSNSFLNSNRR